MNSFHKRYILLALCLVLLVGLLAGCGVDKAAQDEIINYCNVYLDEVAELEDGVMNSFNGVIGDNYTDDETLYNELVDNTLPACNKFVEQVTAYQTEIKNDDLRTVHKTLVKYARALKTAVLGIRGALEAQDYDKMVEAQKLFYDAEDIGVEFGEQLDDLCEKYDIVNTDDQANKIIRPSQRIYQEISLTWSYVIFQLHTLNSFLRLWL